MSHRRKSKLEPDLKETFLPVGTNIGLLVFDIVQSSKRHFHCEKCSSSECLSIPNEDGSVLFECRRCGWQVDIVSPCFLGMSHDLVLGYGILEYTDDSMKYHYIGYGLS